MATINIAIAGAAQSDYDAFLDAQSNGFVQVDTIYYSEAQDRYFINSGLVYPASDGHYLEYPVGNTSVWDDASNTYHNLVGGYEGGTTTTTTTTTSSTSSTSSTSTSSTSSTTTTAPSSYGLFLYKETKNLGGRTIRLEIYMKGFEGEAEEIEKMANPPLICRLDNAGGDLHTPIIKSSLTIGIVDTDQFDYTIFFTPDATKFMVYVKIDGNLEWSGYLTPDSFMQSLVNSGFITLIARDNLGMWNEFNFDVTGDTGIIRDILSYGLTKIGFTSSVLDRVTKECDEINILDLAVPLADRREGTWWEAMANIFRGCGIQLRYIGGNNYALFDLANINNYGNTQMTQEFVFVGQSGTMEIIPAWRELYLTQDYGLSEEIFEGEIPDSGYSYETTKTINGVAAKYYTLFTPGWSLWGLRILKPSEWDYAAQNMFLTGNLYDFPTARPSTSYQRYVPEIKSGITILLNVSNCVYAPAMTRQVVPEPTLAPYLLDDLLYTVIFRCNIFLQTATKTYILRDYWKEYVSGGEQEYLDFELEPAGKIVQVFTGGTQRSVSAYNIKQIELKIEINNIPEQGTLRLYLYPWQIKESTQRGMITTDFVQRISSISMQVQTDDVADFEKTYLINSDYNVKSSIDLKVGETPLYQGNSLTYKGGIFKNSTYKDPARGFNFEGNATEYNLYDLVSYELISMYNVQRRKITGTIISDKTRANILSL